ncbi:MAG: hypothetical protein E7672_00305 [Ruminococcaceae bacterium]|nr:hypothetical protein [Oscillospiraceae bacterium]
MKKITIILIVFFVLLTGCARKRIIDTDKIHTDYVGVYITLESIDDTEDEKGLQVKWYNETGYRVIFGEYYTIEYKDGDEWTETRTADVEFREIGHILKPYSTEEKTYTTEFFDLSKNGTYRLRTSCVVSLPEDPNKSSDNSVSCTVWFEFDVRSPAWDKVRHTLTMNDPEWLYESLDGAYDFGETVEVKISKAYDVGYIFFVNGKPLGNDSYSEGDDYWQFSFVMPDEPVVIDFKTYDGFLPDMNYGILIETYWTANPEAELVSVREYYGEFASGAIVGMIDAFDHIAVLWSEEVGGWEFRYIDGNRIIVLYEGEFYTLSEAYEKGYLTDSDLSTIHEKFREMHEEMYMQEIL